MDIDSQQEINSPPTPIHPAPNEELTNDLPTGIIADSNIDLNPDLYDDDDDDDDVQEQEQKQLIEQNEHVTMPYIQQLQHQDASVSVSASATESELEDVDITQLQQITLPFNESYQLLKLSFENSTNNNGNITTGQQSKFINYLDEILLQIQRKYIKQKTESVMIYSLIELLQDLSNVINLIWVSIQQKLVLFGQIEYYIKILGDLEDYVSNYPHLFNESWSTGSGSHRHLQIDMQNLVIFFKFWQKIDLQLSFLIDGYNVDINGNGKLMKMNTTEITRLLPIISRLRILIISKIDMIRGKLKHGDDHDDNILNIFEVEISRIFEGVLERT